MPEDNKLCPFKQNKTIYDYTTSAGYIVHDVNFGICDKEQCGCWDTYYNKCGLNNSKDEKGVYIKCN